MGASLQYRQITSLLIDSEFLLQLHKYDFKLNYKSGKTMFVSRNKLSDTQDKVPEINYSWVLIYFCLRRNIGRLNKVYKENEDMHV